MNNAHEDLFLKRHHLNSELEETDNEIFTRVKNYFKIIFEGKYHISESLTKIKGYRKDSEHEKAFEITIKNTRPEVQFLKIDQDDEDFFNDYNMEYLLMGKFGQVDWNGKEPQDI